jgi:hypothetical protein
MLIKYSLQTFQLACFFRGVLVAFSLIFFIALADAQPVPGTTTNIVDKVIDKLSSKKDLFESDDVLTIKLVGNVRDVLADRGDNAAYHSLVLSYKAEDSSEVLLTVDAKTRGHFRKSVENCAYPPLLLRFSKSKTLQSSIFRNQEKLKLVMPCRGDEYIIREWLVYKLYNLITPKSFRARLVSVQFDNGKKKNSTPFYGMLIEEETQMAQRSKTIAVKRKLVPEQTETNAFLKMAVFEYLIGNTDWSVQYLQNVKLLAEDSSAIAVPVPYDFDHAGIVNTPYAKPAEELRMSSVRERRYRGYCVPDTKSFEEVIDFYNKLKTDIYGVYTNCTLVDDKYKKTTILYLNDFYKTINNPKIWQKEFTYPCDKSGTGNVVIRGLKKGD